MWLNNYPIGSVGGPKPASAASGGRPSQPSESPDCPRCGGAMVLERFVDLMDDSGSLVCNAWRCIPCGNVVDPVIDANRTNPPPLPARPLRERRLAKAG